MRGFKYRRVKTLFITILSFFCCFLILLNIMVIELNGPEKGHILHTDRNSIEKKVLNDQQKKETLHENLEHYQYSKFLERKPQGINEGQPVKKNNSVSYLSVQHITENQKHKIERDYRISQLKKQKKLKDSSVYQYEADINKAYIEDEDEDDEDEDEDNNYSDSISNNGDSNQELSFGDSFSDKKILYSKPKLKFQEVPIEPKTQLSVAQSESTTQGNTQTKVMRDVVVDRIYWSTEVKQLVPKGFDDAKLYNWTKNIRQQPVKFLKLPTWNKCGRAKNKYVILEDGTSLCGRYRHPHNKLVLGEVLSFYLSKLLKMDNVPGVVLSKLDTSLPQWSGHNLTAAGWEEGQFVAFIQWIPDIESRKSYVYMPKQILEALESKSVVDAVSLADDHLSPEVLTNLVQWGTMLIFDYLTGNYDRVGSMQDGAYREKKPSIMEENIRNLRQSLTTHKLWLIDNESGLLDAYDLLYKGGVNGNQFITFHQQMLQTMCIFERELVLALESLVNTSEPHKTLENFSRQREVYMDQIPRDDSYNLFKKMFSKRLHDVFEWIQYCKTK